MRSLVFTVALLVSLPALAEVRTCAHLFPDAIDLDYTKFQKLFWETQIGPYRSTEAYYPSKEWNELSDKLKFIWNMPHPPYVKNNADGTQRQAYNGKISRDYIGQWFAKDQPLIALGRMGAATAVQSDAFHAKVYAHYDGKIRDQLIQDLHSIDAELESNRTSMGRYGEVATFRVYDGSEKPFGWYFRDDFPTSRSPFKGTLLPFERLNHRRNLPFLPVDFFLHSERAAGRKVFEVGKFSLEGTPDERERGRKIVELFWLRYFAEVYPDGLFVAHCASAVHVRHYKSRYGFEVAEAFEAPGNPDREYILITSGRELAKKLGPLVGLEPREFAPHHAPPRVSWQQRLNEKVETIYRQNPEIVDWRKQLPRKASSAPEKPRDPQTSER